MLIFLLLSVSIGAGMYSCYALLCNWIFRLILSPLQVPASFPVEARRERLMTFLLFVSLPLSYLGVIVLAITYIRGIYFHVRDRRAGISAVLPRIPRMALGEMMVMVLSLAVFPIFLGGLIEALVIFVGQPGDAAMENWQSYKTVLMVSSFAVGAALFPLCFASAFQRLDGNKVPLGRMRSVFLFLYPYLTFAMHPLLVGGVAGVILWGVGERAHPSERLVAALSILWFCTAILLAVGRYLAYRLSHTRPPE